jgi:uracil-DNA glycosylase family 4
MDLEQLSSNIQACRSCELAMTAGNHVPGLGDIGAKYFILGKSPSKAEEEAGMPFIGYAGKKLNELIKLAGISLNDVYFSNVLRCRLLEGRNPKKKELAACVEHLWQELELVQPEYIITTGAVPLSLFTDEGIDKLHGTQFQHTLLSGKTVTILPMYHPDACIHNPRLWATMLEDWQHKAGKVDASFTLVDRPPKPGTTVSLDTETDGSGGLGQWSLAWREDGAVKVCPFFGPQPWLDLDKYEVVFHHAKYDLQELKKHGMKLPTKIQDTFIEAYCKGLGKQSPSDEGKKTSGSNMVGGLGLKYLVRRHLGMEQHSWKYISEHPAEQKEYNAKDSVGTLLLDELWRPTLPDHYYTIDMPLLPVLMAIEDRGIRIDPSFLKTYAELLDKELASYDLPLNPFSPDEIRSYVYGTLEIEPWTFTDSGAPSVDEESLSVLHDPLLDKMFEWKHLMKDKETYLSNYISGMDIHNRIHAEFKQTSTTTGRLSCAKPNLQNVDKVGEMRKLFSVAEGHKLVRLDWHLVEFGMLAVLSKDEKLIQAFLTGDVHQETANGLGIDRDTGKHINFLMQNGGTAWGMARTYGIPIELAKEYFRKYFERFPAIKRFQEETVAKAKETKMAEGPWGRKHRIDALFSSDWKIVQAGENEAKTMPMQNGAAEMVKLAMIDLHYNHHAPMISQIHDELLFEIPEREALDYAHWLKTYVPTITKMNGIEFPIEVGLGASWFESAQKQNEVK